MFSPCEIIARLEIGRSCQDQSAALTVIIGGLQGREPSKALFRITSLTVIDLPPGVMFHSTWRWSGGSPHSARRSRRGCRTMVAGLGPRESLLAIWVSRPRGGHLHHV